MYSAHIAIDPITSQRRIQTCEEHSRAVAALAKAELETCGLGEAAYLAGLLHDCGKFTDEFDAYLQSAVAGEAVKRGSVIHTFAGVRYLLKHFHSHGSLQISDISAEVLAASVGSHHGLIDIWDEYHQNGFDHRLSRQPQYDRRAIEHFQAQCAAPEEIQKLFHSANSEIIQFFQKKIAPYHNNNEAFFALGLLVRLLTSTVVDADRTDTRCFEQNIPLPKLEIPSWEACAARINAHVAAFPHITPIQQARRAFSDYCTVAAERKAGLYRLDLPTGGGKTLAALRFAVLHAKANKLRRVIYAAPLLSIIDQNAKAIREAVGDTASVLEHHSNLLRDEASEEELAQTELLQENWDAQIIITTFVQLLNTLFDGKMPSVRRFECLCESVIIIDEVQSLPPKLLSMFNVAVNFLVKGCGATVLLCSATQPTFTMADHKMIPCERLIGEVVFQQYAPLFRRTVIRDGGSVSIEELAERAAEISERAGSLLIVCNTKREAAEIFLTLGKRTNAKLFHLSAGMCMAHREQTLEEIGLALERKEPLICVSTQLIEAGVDVSFGAVIRLSAGLDNIVQCAGRCNRHGESVTPQDVYIYRLKNEKLGSLKEIRAAQDALNELLEEYRRDEARYFHDLVSDAAIRDYYAALYRNMPRGVQDYSTRGQTLFELLSTNGQFAGEGAPRYYLAQAFRTAGKWFEALDSVNESVLVPYGEGAELIEQLNERRAGYDIATVAKILRKAKPYAVSLATEQIDRMHAKGMIYTLLDCSIYILNAHYYDPQLGIKEGNDLCSTLIL